MDHGYAPSSAFLVQVANGDVPITGSAFAKENLRRVIALMQDDDVSNRDWATMLVAITEVDTPEVRHALLTAAADEDAAVRAEALSGLATRDKALAMPLIAEELLRHECEYATFEAAEIIGDPAYLPALHKWLQSVQRSHVQDQIADAIAACSEAAQAS
ncbi:MAG: lyase [Sphingomonadales bacterium]